MAERNSSLRALEKEAGKMGVVGEPERLSSLLQRLVVPESGITVDALHQHFGAQGTALLTIVLAVPFLLPVPIPGFSTIFGLGIAVLAFQALKPSAALPRWLGNRTISQAAMGRIQAKGQSLMQRLDRLGRPGRAPAFNVVGKVGVCALIAFSALLLAIPIPPVIPFTNTLPAVAIILLAFGQLRRDGLVILGGKVAAVAATLYLAFVGHSVAFASSWIASRLM